MAHAGDLGLLAVRRRGDVTHVIPKGWSRIIKYRYDSEVWHWHLTCYSIRRYSSNVCITPGAPRVAISPVWNETTPSKREVGPACRRAGRF